MSSSSSVSMASVEQPSATNSSISDYQHSDLECIEVEGQEGQASEESSQCTASDDEVVRVFEPYSGEPIADDDWIRSYRERQREKRELEENLQRRMSGALDIRDWCQCGNCNVANLQNISECYCCSEIEGCSESMNSDVVTQELDPGQVLTCITQHPGFHTACLNTWHLKLVYGKYKTKQNQKYRQTASTERFYRAIAYREFTRLVYGYLGNKRIPLPACAYKKIREEFPADIANDAYTGFEMEDE